MDDEEAAEAFAELEKGGGEAQEVVPAPHGGRLKHAVWAKDPFPDGLVLCSFPTERPFHPAGPPGVGVDREAVERPDEEGGQDEPLSPGEQLGHEGSEARSIGGGDAEDGVDEVEGGEREGKGQAAGSAAHVEGQRDGEDDGREEDDGGGDAYDPH